MLVALRGDVEGRRMQATLINPEPSMRLVGVWTDCYTPLETFDMRDDNWHLAKVVRWARRWMDARMTGQRAAGYPASSLIVSELPAESLSRPTSVDLSAEPLTRPPIFELDGWEIPTAGTNLNDLPMHWHSTATVLPVNNDRPIVQSRSTARMAPNACHSTRGNTTYSENLFGPPVPAADRPMSIALPEDLYGNHWQDEMSGTQPGSTSDHHQQLQAQQEDLSISLAGVSSMTAETFQPLRNEWN